MLLGYFPGNNLSGSSSAIWKCSISRGTEIITLGIEEISFFRLYLNVYLSSAFPKIPQHAVSSWAAWTLLSSDHLFNSLAEFMFSVRLSPSLSPSTQRAPCLWRPTWETLNAALRLSLAVWWGVWVRRTAGGPAETLHVVVLLNWMLLIGLLLLKMRKHSCPDCWMCHSLLFAWLWFSFIGFFFKKLFGHSFFFFSNQTIFIPVKIQHFGFLWTICSLMQTCTNVCCFFEMEEYCLGEMCFQFSFLRHSYRMKISSLSLSQEMKELHSIILMGCVICSCTDSSTHPAKVNSKVFTEWATEEMHLYGSDPGWDYVVFKVWWLPKSPGSG